MTTPTDGSMLGLGFGNHSSSTEGSVDDMMQHYLQQCLEFHNEQTKLKEQQEEQEAQNVQFVPPVKEEERILQPSLQEAVSKAKEVIQSFPPVRSEAVVAAIAKAKAIVANFQLSPPQPTTDSLLPCDYKNRRMAFFERQSKRLEKALYKNFAYIAKRDEERLQQKLQQVEAAKQLEQRMRDEHVRKLQQRAANQQQLQAGIGTTVQRKASRKRKAEQVSLRKQEQDPSLYMSGLPTATITEDLIRGLFASYGKIRRVQFYRNKQTGALKGDGLIAYDSAGIEDPASFLLSICVQNCVALFVVSSHNSVKKMNGCELACGTSIQVEPASTSYSNPQRYGHADSSPSKSTIEVKPPEESKVECGKDGDNDEDLDDFFASL